MPPSAQPSTIPEDPLSTDDTGAVTDAASRPDVGVVLVTHNRPELMRAALASILAQDHPGAIRVVVVFDRSDPDRSLERSEGNRSVSVTTNQRSPGLAGARNTGVLALDTELVAFCDDDDEWLPGKLRAQVERLHREADAEFVTTAMRVDYGDRSTVRLAGREHVGLDDLVRSRMAMLHSTSFLFRRRAMLEGFGMVDETLPRSMAEDWDLLLRAARSAPIAHVDEPLVSIRWGATSYFNEAWADKNEAHSWLLEHHPEIGDDQVGAAMLYGKLAFGHAALGERREALRWAGRCVRRRPREGRWPLALLVVAGVSAEWIQRETNRRGHGV
ncbi:glycosyltransferase family 2 protein [Phycicoccus sp. BSK3Z-2]|uniref:Glycosyltransferase family 2 protein n=1 Tax=Phycicoccus avicenniae TaxID=2828860 RepID=A0A941D7V7_9MICO|nr:glycosyltransferase family A protein [Phycicoccus avicenniae]MBR7743694.1 glycosyltransferase family 2 protein [Phycicoccus avicenniae]